VTKLKNEFSRKQWKKCCGHGCKKCEIAGTYIAAHGRDEGLKLLNDDRAAVKRKRGKKARSKKSKKAKKS